MTSSEKLVYHLKMNHLKIACAESCTGGLLSKNITDVSGSSEVFELGIVAYANRIKVKFLGVSEELLAEKGAVYAEVAEQMAKGVCLRAESDLGVGITGIAGPDGGTSEKPVGLVYTSVYVKRTDSYHTEKLLLSGSRDEIRNATVESVKLKAITIVEKL